MKKKIIERKKKGSIVLAKDTTPVHSDNGSVSHRCMKVNLELDRHKSQAKNENCIDLELVQPI